MLPIVALLLQHGLGTIANAVLNKGKELVEEKLGVNLEQELQSDEGRLKLRQLEVEREEMLLQIALENRKVDLEEQKLEIADTSNARDNNAKIQDSEHASWNAKNAAYLLDYLIVVGTIALAYLIFFTDIPDGNKEIAFAAFGSLMTLCGTIINFHRGTSRQSQTKNYTVDNLAATLAKQQGAGK